MRQAVNIPGERENLLDTDCRIWVQGRQEAAHNHSHTGRAQHMWGGVGQQAPEMLTGLVFKAPVEIGLSLPGQVLGGGSGHHHHPPELSSP